MSQRASACRCPAVTVELNHFPLTTPARTKPRDPAASSSSDVCPRCFGERLQKRPDLAVEPHRAPGAPSLLRVLDYSRSTQREPPHSPGHSIAVQGTWWGTSGVPNRAEWPQPHRLGAAERWLCVAFGSWSSAGGTWIWALVFTCAASGTTKRVDRSGACSNIVKLRQYSLSAELQFEL